MFLDLTIVRRTYYETEGKEKKLKETKENLTLWICHRNNIVIHFVENDQHALRNLLYTGLKVGVTGSANKSRSRLSTQKVQTQQRLCCAASLYRSARKFLTAEHYGIVLHSDINTTFIAHRTEVLHSLKT